MKNINKIILFVVMLILSSNLHAEIIYSNLSHDGSFSSVDGWVIRYPFGQLGQCKAFSFTSSNDYYLTSVDLAIGNGNSNGSNEFLVAIYNDSFGTPGTILNTAIGIAPSTDMFNIPPESVTNVFFTGSTLLSNGSRYWIGIHPASEQPTDLGWWWNNLNVQSQSWGSNLPWNVFAGGTWEGTYVCTEGAYQINGNITPEPATLALMGLGGLMIRKKK